LSLVRHRSEQVFAWLLVAVKATPHTTHTFSRAGAEISERLLECQA
jgi:hypothetical protein